jgi:hypothetical protein
VRREDAGCFVEELHGDNPELASHLRIEERELEAGQLVAVRQSGQEEARERTPPRSRRGITSHEELCVPESC